MLWRVHQALVLPHIDEAAAHEVGAGQNFAGLAVHGGHDDDEAVLRQMLAVPQDDVATSPTPRPSTMTAPAVTGSPSFISS